MRVRSRHHVLSIAVTVVRARWPVAWLSRRRGGAGESDAAGRRVDARALQPRGRPPDVLRLRCACRWTGATPADLGPHHHRLRLGARHLDADGHPRHAGGRPGLPLHRHRGRLRRCRRAPARPPQPAADGPARQRPLDAAELPDAAAGGAAGRPSSPQRAAQCADQLNHTWRDRQGHWMHASEEFTTANTARDLAALITALRLGQGRLLRRLLRHVRRAELHRALPAAGAFGRARLRLRDGRARPLVPHHDHDGPHGGRRRVRPRAGLPVRLGVGPRRPADAPAARPPGHRDRSSASTTGWSRSPSTSARSSTSSTTPATTPSPTANSTPPSARTSTPATPPRCCGCGRATSATTTPTTSTCRRPTTPTRCTWPSPAPTTRSCSGCARRRPSGAPSSTPPSRPCPPTPSRRSPPASG